MNYVGLPIIARYLASFLAILKLAPLTLCKLYISPKHYLKLHLRRDMIINKICHKPISIIHSTFKEPKEAPTQPTKEKDIEGKVEISDSATC